MHQRHVIPEFAALLERQFDLRSLDEHPDSVVGLLPDSTIAYLNKAWFSFAAENGWEPQIQKSWGLETRYLDAISPALRWFYRRLLERASEASESLRPVVHEYECPSPTGQRLFSMKLYSLEGGAGLLIVHSLVAESAHDDDCRHGDAPSREAYTNDFGLISQCANCRGFRSLEVPGRWDWVPEWVEHPVENVSHTVCSVCLQFYYGQPGRSAAPSARGRPRSHRQRATSASCP